MIKKLARTFAERVSRNVVVKRRLPKEFGRLPIYVSPGAALRYWRFDARKYDDFLYDVAKTFVSEGVVVWDVGANVGLFALSAAARGGEVLALEPDITLASLIRRTADLRPNRNYKIDLLPAAVSSEVAIAHLQIAKRGRMTNHLSNVIGSSQTGGGRQKVATQTVTLDWLLEHFLAPSFVKIDVEGAEELVLTGASRLLAETRPVIVIEIQDYTVEKVMQTFLDNQYECFEAAAIGGYLIPPTATTENILAIPQERVEAIESQL